MSLLDKDSRSTGTADMSMGSRPSAATASTCSATPVPRSISAIREMGWTVPISLLAHPTDTRTVSSVIRERSLSGSMRPNWSGGTLVTRKPDFSRNLPMLCSEMCSTSEMITWAPSRLARLAYPMRARLFDSVAPDVKMTSSGCAPMNAATPARPSSNTAVARSPTVCSEAGLPKRSVKYGSIASTTRGSTGFADW